MALVVDDREVDRLITEIADITGESASEIVLKALKAWRERLSTTADPIASTL